MLICVFEYTAGHFCIYSFVSNIMCTILLAVVILHNSFFLFLYKIHQSNTTYQNFINSNFRNNIQPHYLHTNQSLTIMTLHFLIFPIDIISVLLSLKAFLFSLFLTTKLHDINTIYVCYIDGRR
jgi:hypothetical protein